MRRAGLLLLVSCLVASSCARSPAQASRAAPKVAASCDITPAAARLLPSLTGVLSIHFYAVNDPEHASFVRKVKALLDAYVKVSAGHVRVEIVEPTTPAQKKEAADKGVVAYTPNGRTEKAYLGLSFEYGSESDALPYLNPDQATGVEFFLFYKLRQIVDRSSKAAHPIGLLTGHGGVAFDEGNLGPSDDGLSGASMKMVIERNFPFFAFRNVDLQGGVAAVDPSLEGLMITQPATTFTRAELRRIDEFVMQGKPVAVFASSVNLAPHDAKMKATLDPHGLDELLSGYGIELHHDVVLDSGGPWMAKTSDADAELLFPAIPMLSVDTEDHGLLDTEFAAFFRLERLPVPFSSSLEIHPERQPNAKVRLVAASASATSTLTGDVVNLDPFQSWPPQSARNRVGLAAIAEGRLKSAFDADPPHARVGAGRRGRVFVVSSAQIFTNPFLRAGSPAKGSGGTIDARYATLADRFGDVRVPRVPALYEILLCINTLDWMTLDEDTEALASHALVCE